MQTMKVKGKEDGPDSKGQETLVEIFRGGECTPLPPLTRESR